MALPASLVAVRTMSAQTTTPSLALGIVAPRGQLGTKFATGAMLRGGYEFGNPRTQRTRVRLDAEVSWLTRRNAATATGDLRIVTGVASLVESASSLRTVAPYGLLGVAVERMSVAGTTNPYGTTFGLRAALGVRWRLRGRTLVAEVAPHVALTDFATGGEYSPSVRVPLSFAVSF
ncbi:MAG: hypothetical protein IT353_10440 [Gemmatimonadaceae bacterium]|nr:hypothetical protein [Gemmatimonadaceae bacterium]